MNITDDALLFFNRHSPKRRKRKDEIFFHPNNTLISWLVEDGIILVKGRDASGARIYYSFTEEFLELIEMVEVL